jgi:hypothetical protein
MNGFFFLKFDLSVYLPADLRKKLDEKSTLTYHHGILG